MKRTFIAVATFACLALTVPSLTSADSSPNPAAGEVVFSNAGRIVSIRADGSERTILTRKGSRVGSRDFAGEWLGMGDQNPVISPDGRQIAFLRNNERAGEFSNRLMVGARNGSALKAVFGLRNSYLNSLDWTPDGRLLVTLLAFMGRNGKRQEIYQQRLLRLDSDGQNRQILLAGKPGDFLDQPWLGAEDISPDGSSLLYTRMNMKQAELRIRNLENNEDHRVTFGGFQGSFSADGGRIVLAAGRCFEDEDRKCERGKWLRPGLWTVATDGGDLRPLISDESAGDPSYSPDGSRILFASGRNTPGSPETATEIYSVTPDGQCLTWLTNGSPASNTPSWGPEVDADYSPGTCGAAGRQPLVELRPLPPRKTDPRPRLWAGPRVGSRLLSSLSADLPWSRSEIYEYGDCAYFYPGRCSRPLTLESATRLHGFDELAFGERRRTLTRRGTKVLRTWDKGRPSGTLLRAGRSAYGIGQTIFTRSRPGRRNTFADHLRLISLLRPVGQPLIPGSKLPAPVNAKPGKRR